MPVSVAVKVTVTGALCHKSSAPLATVTGGRVSSAAAVATSVAAGAEGTGDDMARAGARSAPGGGQSACAVSAGETVASPAVTKTAANSKNPRTRENPGTPHLQSLPSCYPSEDDRTNRRGRGGRPRVAFWAPSGPEASQEMLVQLQPESWALNRPRPGKGKWNAWTRQASPAACAKNARRVCSTRAGSESTTEYHSGCATCSG